MRNVGKTENASLTPHLLPGRIQPNYHTKVFQRFFVFSRFDIFRSLVVEHFSPCSFAGNIR